MYPCKAPAQVPDHLFAECIVHVTLPGKLDHAVLEFRCLLQPGLDRLFGTLPGR